PRRARRRRHGGRGLRPGTCPRVDGPGADLRAALDAVGAHVALARDRLDEARRLASTAVAAADGHPAVECEALEVLGRLAPESEAAALFRRAADVAGRHGLTTWRLRALQELALAEATPGGEHVRELRRVAADA